MHKASKTHKVKKGKPHNQAHKELMAIYGNADNPDELRTDLGPSIELNGVDVKLDDATAWNILHEDSKARAQIAERNKEKAESERRAAVQLAKQLEERNKNERSKFDAEKAKYETEKAQQVVNRNTDYNREVDQLRDVRIRLQNDLEAERLRRVLGYPSDAAQVARYLEKERIKKEVKEELEEAKKIKQAERALTRKRSISRARRTSSRPRKSSTKKASKKRK